MTEETQNNIDIVTPDVPAETKSNEEILAAMLGQYSEPAVTHEAPPEVPAPSEPAPVADDLTDPKLYYQSGAKKGQRKKPRVKIEPNAANETPEKVVLSDVLTGALFITLIDLLLPLLISVIHNRVSKHKIKSSDLEMTGEQRRRLTPLADAVVKRWNIEAHPGILLLCGMAGIYGMNYALIAQSIKSKPDTEKK